MTQPVPVPVRLLARSTVLRVSVAKKVPAEHRSAGEGRAQRSGNISWFRVRRASLSVTIGVSGQRRSGTGGNRAVEESKRANPKKKVLDRRLSMQTFVEVFYPLYPTSLSLSLCLSLSLFLRLCGAYVATS